MKPAIKKLKDFIHTLCPSDKTEWTVVTSLMLYFSIISIPFCLSVQPEDAGLLGYDTVGHLTVSDMKISLENAFHWNLRHPLYRMLYLPVILVNEALLLSGLNVTWPLFLAFTILLMSGTGLFVFKTLRALNLTIFSSAMVLVLFCSFAHTVMLSIQVDSFVMSMFFGSMMVLLLVTKKSNTLTDNLLFLGITGTTSTNCFKVAFYQLIEKRSITKAAKRFLKTIPLFSIFFLLTVPNLFTRLIERPRGLMYAVMGDSFSFQGSDISKWKLFIENFLCEPILFHHTTGIIYSHETTHLPAYSFMWCYVPIAIVFILVAYSVARNYRHSVIHLFCCCFGFDMFMHFAVGYGMEEAQLFCGHWLFFIPIILGLLLANKNINGKLLAIILLLLCVYFLGHNLLSLFRSM